MKEATGELSTTVLTIIAISAVAALFYAFVWPMIQRTIANRTCQMYGTDYKAEKTDKDVDEYTSKWKCCNSSNTCFQVDEE